MDKKKLDGIRLRWKKLGRIRVVDVEWLIAESILLTRIDREHSEICTWSGCDRERQGAWRFCKTHLEMARGEIMNGNYLTKTGWLSKSTQSAPGPRTCDASGLWDNVVKAIEDR